MRGARTVVGAALLLAAACASQQAKENRQMLPPGTMQAFAKKVRDHPDVVKVVRDGPAPSVPVPLLVRTDPQHPRTHMAFVFYRVRMKDEEQRLYVVSKPKYHLVMDLLSKKLVGHKRMEPGDLGQQWDPTRPLGTWQAPEGLDWEALSKKRERYYELYDQILPAFEAGQVAFSAEEQQRRAEFNKLHDELIHPPMRRFVEALNPAWFSWLKR